MKLRKRYHYVLIVYVRPSVCLILKLCYSARPQIRTFEYPTNGYWNMAHLDHQIAASHCLSHDLTHPSFCYHISLVIEKYDFEVVQYSTNSTSNFIHIHSVVLGFNQPITRPRSTLRVKMHINHRNQGTHGNKYKNFVKNAYMNFVHSSTACCYWFESHYMYMSLFIYEF